MVDEVVCALTRAQRNSSDWQGEHGEQRLSFETWKAKDRGPQ